MPANEEQVQSVLDRSQAQAVVRVLPGFARDLARGRGAEVQVLVDGTNSNTASLISSYAGQILAKYSTDAMGRQQNGRVLTQSPGSAVNASVPQVTARSRVWFNPDLYSRNYFVPGVVANIIMMVTLMLTALAIVREKEIGTMGAIDGDAAAAHGVDAGQDSAVRGVGLVDVTLVTALALVLFHVPFNGSFPLLLCCSCCFLRRPWVRACSFRPYRTRSSRP